jgi:hypothetical protein
VLEVVTNFHFVLLGHFFLNLSHRCCQFFIQWFYLLRAGLFDFEGVEERRAFFVLREEVSFTVEFFHYKLTDHKSESDAFGVYASFGVLYRSKHLKHAALVSLPDA